MRLIKNPMKYKEILWVGVSLAFFIALLSMYMNWIYWPHRMHWIMDAQSFEAWFGWMPGMEKAPEGLAVHYEWTGLKWLGLLCFWPLLPLILHWTLSDLPWWQQWINLLLRSALILAIVMALVQPHQVREESHVGVVALVDVSDSIPQLQPYAKAIRTLNAAKGSQNTFKVLTFAGQNRLLSDDDLQKGELSRLENGSATNLQAALKRAYGLFPPEYIKRVWVASDGRETQGHWLEEVARAREKGIRIDVFHPKLPPIHELAIRELIVPNAMNIRVDKPFEWEVYIHSSLDQTIKAKLKRQLGKQKAHVEELDLEPGLSVFTFKDTAFEPGLLDLKASLILPHCKPGQSPVFNNAQCPDHFRANNKTWEKVWVSDKARILYVGDSHSEFLRRALEGTDPAKARFKLEIRNQRGLPQSRAEARKFDLIILANTPVYDPKRKIKNLSQNQLQVLDAYVQYDGGGLIAIGGDQAFGMGGYEGTALEQILPIRFDAKAELRQDSVALALVIDKSDSMKEHQKLELAKEAAKQAVNALNPKTDRVMVIAFDAKPKKVVPLTRVSQKSRIIKQISRIRAAKGTHIEPALFEAYMALALTSAKIKHVILLTDGQSPYGGIYDLVKQMQREHITISTIAVGSGADTILLGRMAKLGGGRSYFTQDPYAIPRLFLQETSRLTQNAIVETPLRPQVLLHHPMIRGLDFKPLLLGYVATQAKPKAKVILRDPDKKLPLLVTWTYGRGKVTVFTSDAKNRWASAWVSTSKFFPKFWNQVASYTLRDRSETYWPLNATIDHRGEAKIWVDALDDNGLFINRLQATITLRSPKALDQEKCTDQICQAQFGEGWSCCSQKSCPMPCHKVMPLEQRAPGRYVARLPLKAFGTYDLQVQFNTIDEQKHSIQVAQSRGTLAYPYAQEYALLQNPSLLDQAAAITGGKVNPSPSELFDPLGQSIQKRKSLWPPFLYIALILLILDLLFKRISLWKRHQWPWSKVIGL